MRIIIIGAVAAGTSAAAKARRNDETAEIVIYDKDSFITSNVLFQDLKIKIILIW